MLHTIHKIFVFIYIYCLYIYIYKVFIYIYIIYSVFMCFWEGVDSRHVENNAPLCFYGRRGVEGSHL